MMVHRKAARQFALVHQSGFAVLEVDGVLLADGGRSKSLSLLTNGEHVATVLFPIERIAMEILVPISVSDEAALDTLTDMMTLFGCRASLARIVAESSWNRWTSAKLREAIEEQNRRESAGSRDAKA